MSFTAPTTTKDGQPISRVTRHLADQISDHICGLGSVDQALLQQFMDWLALFTNSENPNTRCKSAKAFKQVAMKTTRRKVTTSAEIRGEAILLKEEFDLLRRHLKNPNGAEVLNPALLYKLIHICVAFSQALGKNNPMYHKNI